MRIAKGQEGFTVAELAVVIFLITMILAVTVVVYHNATARTDMSATAEMLKDDIRKVYAKADSAVAVSGDLGQKYRDKYKIEFHTNEDDPPNCYRVMKSTYSDGAYGDWALVVPDKHGSNKIIDGQWVQPSSSGETVISSAPANITFLSKGSIIETDKVGDVQIVLQEGPDGSKTETVIVSKFGSVE